MSQPSVVPANAPAFPDLSFKTPDSLRTERAPVEAFVNQTIVLLTRLGVRFDFDDPHHKWLAYNLTRAHIEWVMQQTTGETARFWRIVYFAGNQDVYEPYIRTLMRHQGRLDRIDGTTPRTGG